jgi:hypothetical protein
VGAQLANKLQQQQQAASSNPSQIHSLCTSQGHALNKPIQTTVFKVQGLSPRHLHWMLLTHQLLAPVAVLAARAAAAAAAAAAPLFLTQQRQQQQRLA